MKKAVILLCILCASAVTRAQFRETAILQPGIRESIVDTRSNFVLGLFDPAKFSMRQSYSMSYTTGGGQGLALGMYTNSMMYRFTDNVELLLDASIVHSPYSTFGRDVQNQLTGFYLNRAQINYRPAENMMISLAFQQIPESYYYTNPFRRSLYYGNSMFSGFPELP